ncbi:MAG: phosphate/phosphite/phosphonate ABC transporter substrate-binding protein [Chloroflexi bacterium]|nr:phosphate/phosphite/phosphonate ABC transporter substrate-binding protein [Chloroflexota bacterium]
MLKTRFLVYGGLLLCLILLGSCSGFLNQQPTLDFNPVTLTAEPLPLTPLPTYTPTTVPIGSEGNPLVMGIIIDEFVAGQNEAVQSVMMHMSEGLGLEVVARPFGNYVDLELALQRSEVQLAWLTAPEYLLASQKNLASSLLVTNHLGVTAYGIQFLGHNDGELESHFDAATNTSPSTAGQALAQLAGLRPCLTEEDSLAGYWVPLGYLNQNSISYLRPVLTFSFSASMRALYIKGVCAYTSTYAISADPRTSSEVIHDLPDVIETLPILWISPAIIPNINLSVSPQIDLTLQNQLSEYLRNFSREDIGKALLSQMLDYEVAQLEPIHDTSYQVLRDLLSTTDVRLVDLAR